MCSRAHARCFVLVIVLLCAFTAAGADEVVPSAGREPVAVAVEEVDPASGVLAEALLHAEGISKMDSTESTVNQPPVTAVPGAEPPSCTDRRPRFKHGLVWLLAELARAAAR